MRARRRSRPQCALCGGPQRHPSTASVNCGSCGALVCLKHSAEVPDRGGWICKRCQKRETAQ